MQVHLKTDHAMHGEGGFQQNTPPLHALDFGRRAKQHNDNNAGTIGNRTCDAWRGGGSARHPPLHASGFGRQDKSSVGQ